VRIAAAQNQEIFMADFVAVLKKTLSGLGETTPEMRARIYDKARATVEAKLAAINPPPAAAVIDRQKKALEDAIAAVEAEYAVPAPEAGDDDLEAAFASLDGRADEHHRLPEVRSPGPVAAPESVIRKPQQAMEADTRPGPHAGAADAAGPEFWRDPDTEQADTENDRPLAGSPAGGRRPRGVGFVLIVILVAILAVAAYAVWLNRVELVGLFGGAPQPVAVAPEQAAAPPDGREAEEDQEETALAPAQPAEEPPAAPAEDEAEKAQPGEPEGPRKFTQRLLPDGTEVDEGPAGETPTVGEGTSVAAASPPAGDEAESDAPVAPAAPAAEQAAIAVGQRAIFYEERTSSEQGSAETGSVVWTVVEESPGGAAPPEPAIRGEATVPGKGIELKLTIRRNADKTLPASHIVELIFLMPEDFAGGTINNVLRMTMKSSEEAPGTPLRGLSARITEGFFLIALNDRQEDVETNLGLMGQGEWIDIPMVYQSGRRALITLEKGIPGERVFNTVIEAWRQASSG
jgi:hypothetical protein